MINSLCHYFEKLSKQASIVDFTLTLLNFSKLKRIKASVLQIHFEKSVFESGKTTH